MLDPDTDLARGLAPRWAASIGILESFVDFACEISVIVARGRRRRLRRPIRRSRTSTSTTSSTRRSRRRASRPRSPMRAEAIARHVAEKLDLVGVLAVEMFVTQSGEMLVNELAPRPHNSGPLDDRRLRHQPVRAVRARDLRPAARLARAPFRRGDEEPASAAMSPNGATRSNDPPPSCISTARPSRAPAARWATSPG